MNARRKFSHLPAATPVLAGNPRSTEKPSKNLYSHESTVSTSDRRSAVNSIAAELVMNKRRIPLRRTGPSAPHFAAVFSRLSRAINVALLNLAGCALPVTGVGLGLSIIPGLAWADTFTVTKLADTSDGVCDADCSLREAVVAANSLDGADTVDASNLAGTITLSGHIDITQPLIIIGPGANLLTVDADSDGNGIGNSQIFSVLEQAADVTIKRLSLANGYTYGSGGAISSGANLTLDGVIIQDSTAQTGGGISVGSIDSAELNLTNCTISGNSATGFGGGFSMRTLSFTGNDVSAILVNTTVTGNSAGVYGGGFYVSTDTSVSGSAAVTLFNSTVNGNSAAGGGGFSVNASLSDYATATLTNSTVTGNSATGNAGGFSVSSQLGSTAAILSNSIVANNVAANGGSDEFDVSSLTAHHSLVEGSSSPGVPNENGNISGVDPQLGPLQNNGGPTFTHALLPGSPAIDAGDPAFVPPPDYDQRGEPFVRV